MATPAAAAALIDIGAACDNAPQSTLNDAETTPTPSGDSNWRDVVDCLNAPDGYEGEDGNAVLSGTDGGNADFSSLVTRAQFAGIFSRIIEAAGLATDENASTPFTDIDGAFFEGAIRAMYGQGLTTGKTATTYDTQGSLIMGQLATFYVGLIEKVTGEALVADGTSNVNSNYGVHSANAEKLFDNGFLTEGQAANGTGSVLRGDIFAMATRALAHFVTEGILDNPFPVPPSPLSTGTIVRCGPGRIDVAGSGAVTAVTYDNSPSSSGSFRVDGGLASPGSFEGACTVGDTLAWDPATKRYELTNVTTSNLTSGTVGNIDPTAATFAFIEPLSGVALRTGIVYSAALYSVDGTTVAVGPFADALNEGDTLTISGSGASRKFALSNRSVTGIVTVAAAAAGVNVDFTVDPVAGDVAALPDFPTLGDDPSTANSSDAVFRATNAGGIAVPATEKFFVGGTAVAFTGGATSFEANISSGDRIQVDRAAGVTNFRLTNLAPAKITGVVRGDGFFIPGAGGDGGTLGIVTATGTVVTGYTSTAKFVRNSLVVNEVEFEAIGKVTPGDVISYQAPDPGTSTLEVIEVTDASLAGRITNFTYSDNNVLDEKFDIETTAGQTIEATFDPLLANARYLVNGGLVSEVDFAQYLESIAKEQAAPGFTGSNDTIEVVTTPGGVDVKLSTTNPKA